MKIPEFTQEQRRGIAILATTAIAISLFFYFSARGEAVPQVKELGSATAISELPATVMYIDVAGKVRSPGVYQLSEGSRVIDAIEMAGGVRRGVDTSHINLARKLVDGEQVLITSKKFQAITPSSGRKTIFTGKVSINSGTKAQFDSLPGIGPVLAQRILDHRSKNGPFAQISDIQNVSGIGTSIFAQISERLTL